jgi:transcriptional regulator with XRE-family HTH domain
MVKIIINTEQVEYIIAKRNKDKKWLADRIGVTQSYLSQWLAHRKNPSPTNRQRIMNCLQGRGITWDRLFIQIRESTITTY